MTANQATYAAMLALDEASSRRNETVRASSKSNQEAVAANRGLYLLSDTRGTGPRGPHPGDVLYWAACLGGACLLLISAT